MIHTGTESTPPATWPKYIRSSHISKELGITRATVRAMVRRGELPRPFRIGSKLLLWDAAAVLAALARLRGEG